MVPCYIPISSDLPCTLFSIFRRIHVLNLQVLATKVALSTEKVLNVLGGWVEDSWKLAWLIGRSHVERFITTFRGKTWSFVGVLSWGWDVRKKFVDFWVVRIVDRDILACPNNLLPP